MGTTNSYPDFEKDIKEVFARCIEEYSFVFSKVFDGCFELSNRNCIVRFSYGEGDIYCTLRQPSSADKIGEGVFPIFNFLYPDLRSDKKDNNYDPIHQLSVYAEILGTKLNNVLKGDFSWLDKFLIQKEQDRKLVGFIWDKIDRNDPIYLKFRNGDISWQNDLKEYLIKHNITL